MMAGAPLGPAARTGGACRGDITSAEACEECEECEECAEAEEEEEEEEDEEKEVGL